MTAIPIETLAESLPKTAAQAWRALLAADQAAFAIPRKRRERSLEALAAAEARIDFVLVCKRYGR